MSDIYLLLYVWQTPGAATPCCGQHGGIAECARPGHAADRQRAAQCRTGA